MNFSELFIRRPIMTLLLTISITAFGIQCFHAVARERPACGRLPRHSGQRDLSGGKPGNDGEYVRNAARKAIPPDPRLGLGDINQPNRSIDTWSCNFLWIRAWAMPQRTSKPRFHGRRDSCRPICLNLPLFRRRIRMISRSTISRW